MRNFFSQINKCICQQIFLKLVFFKESDMRNRWLKNFPDKMKNYSSTLHSLLLEKKSANKYSNACFVTLFQESSMRNQIGRNCWQRTKQKQHSGYALIKNRRILPPLGARHDPRNFLCYCSLYYFPGIPTSQPFLKQENSSERASSKWRQNAADFVNGWAQSCLYVVLCQQFLPHKYSWAIRFFMPDYFKNVLSIFASLDVQLYFYVIRFSAAFSAIKFFFEQLA